MPNETPADKAKREAAEKQAADDKAKADAELQAKLKKAADEEEARILASDEGSNKDQPDDDDPPLRARAAAPWMDNFKSEEQAEAASAAAKQLYSIACEFPQSSPDTHTVFGFGGKLFKLGDLRALFGMRRGG